MTISFIIPTYNRADTLPECIDSVVQQSNGKWEVIIVDDGSTDETQEVVRKYLNDKRIVYYKQDNLGVSVARNKGAEMAKGEYLIFLDSDDTVNRDLVSHLFKIKFFEYDVIFWQVLRKINGKLNIWKPRILDKMYNYLRATFLAGSVCYKKEIFFKAGAYDPIMLFGENYELGLRVANLENLKVAYIDYPLSNYFIDTRSRDSNNLDNKITSHLHQYKKHEGKFLADRKARAKMDYLIGYTYEQKGDKSQALMWYKKARASAPWSIKPHLKIFYLKFFL